MRQKITHLIRAGLFAVLCAPMVATQAGQRCEPETADLARTQQALALASLLQDTLDASGEQVAVIARVGSDMSKYGLRYTHAGLAYRQGLHAPWTVLHKLNRCGSDRSTIYRQGLGNFFLDNPYEYRAKVVFLKPAFAEQVLVAVGSESRIRAVDQPHYSLLAYPFGTGTQNSNGWLLEFLVAASAPEAIHSRTAAQRRLRDTHYRPDVIPVSASQRLGAHFGRANVSFLDHPLRNRLAGEYETVTVESLVRWLDHQGWVASQTDISR